MPQSKPARPTACALLTRADVTAAIGQPVDTGTEQAKAGAGAACTYTSSGETAAGGLLVVASWQKIARAFEAQNIKRSPISGIGDEAFSVFGGGGFPALVVRIGSNGFEISVHGPTVLALPDHGLAAEETLAELVLSRL